jgi:hypothetical protein
MPESSNAIGCKHETGPYRCEYQRKRLCCKDESHETMMSIEASQSDEHVHLAAANDYQFPIHVLPLFRWNTLFGQIMAPRVKEFATSNRANGFRLERDQRDGCSISVNKLDFVCRPLSVDVNDGTDITGGES